MTISCGWYEVVERPGRAAYPDGCEHSHHAGLYLRGAEEFRRLSSVYGHLHLVHGPFTGQRGHSSAQTIEGLHSARSPGVVMMHGRPGR